MGWRWRHCGSEVIRDAFLRLRAKDNKNPCGRDGEYSSKITFGAEVLSLLNPLLFERFTVNDLGKCKINSWFDFTLRFPQDLACPITCRSPEAHPVACAARHAPRSDHYTPNDLWHCSRLVFTSCCHPNDLLRDADEFARQRVPED